MASLLVVVAACSPATTAPSGPSPASSTPSAPDPSSPGPSATGDTDLSIVVDDGTGSTTRWRLTCAPPGGTHPDPAGACQALQTHGAMALPAVPKDRMCSQVFGGAQTATISGSWQGRRVRSTFSLKNGCEIGRWRMLEPLLPPAGA